MVEKTCGALYLCRQPEFLVSYYYTLVSSGNTTEFSDYVDMQEERSFLAYRKIVERWSSVFGKNKVKVCLFDKQAFYENDLLADFAHVAGFDITGLKKVKNENLSSLDSASIEFLRLLMGIFLPMYYGPCFYKRTFP